MAGSFFPEADPKVGSVAAFATFGVGYVTRPIGAVILGHVGDKFGRKNILIFTLLLMGSSTFLIGALPTYNQVGIAAPIMLVILATATRQALNAGAISPGQFLDLNERIGGYDQDFNYIANRVVGDVGAIKRAQQSGLQLGGNGGLASIPIMDITGIYNDDAGYHYQWFHFATRDRMAEANGNADNHVMWRGNPVPFNSAWATFISWVEAAVADTSDRTEREKAIANKPVAATDGCWSSATTFIPEEQTFSLAVFQTRNATRCSPRLRFHATLRADRWRRTISSVS